MHFRYYFLIKVLKIYQTHFYYYFAVKGLSILFYTKSRNSSHEGFENLSDAISLISWSSILFSKTIDLILMIKGLSILFSTKSAIFYQ